MEYYLTYEEMLRSKFSHLEHEEREEKVKEHLRMEILELRGKIAELERRLK